MMYGIHMRNVPPQQLRKVGNFQRSAEQVVLEKLKSVAQRRVLQIKTYQSNIKKVQIIKGRPGDRSNQQRDNVQNQMGFQGTMIKNRGGLMMSQMQVSGHNDQPDYDDQPFHSYPHHNPHIPQYQTIQSIRSSIDTRIKRLQNKFGIPQLSVVVPKAKAYMLKDLDQLAYEVKAQKQKLDESANFKQYRQYLDLFGSKLSKLPTILQRIEEVFNKAEQIANKVNQSRKPNLQQLKGAMNNIEQNYFNYIKSNLIKISIEEGLPKHGKIDYQKIDKNTLKQRQPQNLDSNSVSSLYKTIFSNKTFSGLQDGSWLHNSVIDNYIQYLKYTRGYNDITRSKCAIYSFGESQRFQYIDTYRFSNGPIFTRFERIGLVINVKDQHWFFIGVLPKRGKFIVYDSISKKSDHYTVYLQRIRKIIKKQEKEFNTQTDIVLNQVDDQTTPRQDNGYDCGLHVLWNMTYFLQSLTDPKDKIKFDNRMNKELRSSMYLFMAYLLYLSRGEQTVPKYDWLQFCSRSVMKKGGVQNLQK